MKYLAKDGKVFDNECKCMEYEHSLDEQEKKKEQDMLTLEALADEVDTALDAFAEHYERIYGKTKSSPTDLYVKFLLL